MILKDNPGWWLFWVVGAAGVRTALVCWVVWVAPVGEMASVEWGAIMPAVITAGASIGWRVGWAAAVARRRVWGVPPKVVASTAMQMGVVLWSAVMSPMSVIIIGVLSVSPVVGVSMPWMRSYVEAWCSWWSNLMGVVLDKMSKFIMAIRLGIKAVTAKMTCPSTDKTLIITRHHTDCGRS